MRIFNADGSESAVCGNGLRCLVKYYIDGNTDRKDSEIKIETSIDVRTARIHRRRGVVAEIQVNMGLPKIGISSTPLKEINWNSLIDIKSVMNRMLEIDGSELLVSLVSVGNPHAIHFTERPLDDFPLAKLGGKVEQHQLFPDETNFEAVRIINRQQVEALVWERGVGETLACGSGACAIVSAGNLLGFLDEKVEVKLPGGLLIVEWNRVSDIFLSGPAETVFCGEW
jgi:diaminopimelate epimerase